MEKIVQLIEQFELPRKFALSVIRTLEEFRVFYIQFYNKNDFAFDDLHDYAMHKMMTVDMGLSAFIIMCETEGYKASFENAFQRGFSVSEMSMVKMAVEEGKVNLDSIFNDLRINPLTNVVKYVI